jgi:hypothetical protein
VMYLLMTKLKYRLGKVKPVQLGSDPVRQPVHVEA